MSGGKIIVKQTFGLNPLIRNCLTFTEEHNLAYSCGHQVTVINTETKEQTFISGTSTYQHQSLGITVIKACVSRRLLAVAERVDPTAIITIYDSRTLKRKKLITYGDLGSSEVRSISFSEDGKFMCVQACGPDWNLVLWNIEKTAKVICSLRTTISDDSPIHQVSFCPWDSSIILLLGKNICRLYRFQDGQLKLYPFVMRRENINCVSHCWMQGDNLVVGTDTGDIMFIENFEYRGLISNHAGANDSDWAHPAYSMTPHTTGFVIGTSNGEIRFFERNDDLKEKYSFESSCKLDSSKGNIVAFATGSDDMLVCATSRQQLMSLSLTNALSGKERDVNAPHWAENILTPFHAPNAHGDASITGIDTALWRQILVTCGKDKTLRVWNTFDKRMELMKEFDEEPLSLSMHPSGMYVAVAFSEKILILSLLLDSIPVNREIVVRQCFSVKFARGGHFLACANGTHVQIFSTFTGALMATLRAHNNKIRSILWMNYDSKVVTIGSEGVVYSWEICPTVKRPEQFVGSIPIAGGCGTLDGNKIYVSTQDKLLRELDFTVVANPGNKMMMFSSSSNPSITPVDAAKGNHTLEINHNVSCMLYDEVRKLLLIGTCTDDHPGAIITANVSNYLGALPAEVTAIHSGYITALCQSYDGSLLYSGDSNGCICITEFENSTITKAAAAVVAREGAVSFEFIEEVSLMRSDLQERRLLIEQLTLRVEDLHQSNLHQLRLKNLDHQDRKKEIEDKFSSQINIERNKYQELNAEKVCLESDFARKVKKMEDDHIDELRLIEFKYKTKINQEEHRYKLLQEEIDEAHKRWNDENGSLVESHQKYLQELTVEYEEKLLTEQLAQKHLLVDKEGMKVGHNGLQQDTEVDGDHEVAELKIRFDAKLKNEEETAQSLMQQHSVMTKTQETLYKDSQQQKAEIRRLQDKEARLYETIHSLEKDIQSHKKEIREREETITDKEKRIFDLKKKNQELEKFRFVLDYKIKELKLQIAPRENEINTMRTQISEMDLELDQYHKSNEALNLMIEELKLKLEGIKKDIERQQERCSLNSRLLERFKRDLQEVWALRAEDPAAFKARLIKMYRVYVQEDLSPASLSGTAGPGAGKNIDLDDPQQMYNRDREQMERSLDSLRRALKADALAHKRDVGKMMRESVMLTKELNNLRKQSRLMQLQRKAIDQEGELNLNSELTDLMKILGIQPKRPMSPTPGNNNNNKMMLAPGSAALEAPAPPVTTPLIANVSKHRTTALKTINADGKIIATTNSLAKPDAATGTTTMLSRQDQWEAWREIQMQFDQMKQLEDQITAVCTSLNIDPIPIIVGVDTELL